MKSGLIFTALAALFIVGCSSYETSSTGSGSYSSSSAPAVTEAPKESASAPAAPEAQTAQAVESAPVMIQTATIAVEGMDCGGCVKETEMALKKVEGFKSLKANPQQQQAMVSFDPEKTDVAKLVEAINTGTKFKAKAI